MGVRSHLLHVLDANCTLRRWLGRTDLWTPAQGVIDTTGTFVPFPCLFFHSRISFFLSKVPAHDSY